MDYTTFAVETLKEALIDVWGEAEVIGSAVVMPSYMLKVTVEVDKLGGDNSILATLHFGITHPYLQEEFFDVASSLDETPEKAIKGAVASFVLSVMCALRGLFEGESVIDIETRLMGVNNKWSVYPSCVNTMKYGTQGDPNDEEVEEINFWEVLKDSIPNHLGRKRISWLKIYVAKYGNEIISECRFNEVVSPSLSRLVYDEAAKWPDIKNMVSKKQFFFFLQKEETFVPYPFSKEELAEFTDKAVEVLAKCDSDEEYHNLVPEIYKITKDEFLAHELKSFIPEMCAENCYNQAKHSEAISLAYDDETSVTVFKDQFTPYNTIKRRILNKFFDGSYPSEYYDRLVHMSSISSVVEQAKENNLALEDLTISLGIYVPEDYVVR